MAHYINQDKCICCATCDVECPFHAVVISHEGKFSIDKDKCRDCKKCAEACPMDAIEKMQ